jgi:lipoyl synthase
MNTDTPIAGAATLDNAAGTTLNNAAGVKHKGEGKTSRIPIKVISAPMLRKPDWIQKNSSRTQLAFRV